MRLPGTSRQVEKCAVLLAMHLQPGVTNARKGFWSGGGVGAPSDYSGFDPCSRRQNDEHRRQAAEIRNRTSQEDSDKLTSL